MYIKIFRFPFSISKHLLLHIGECLAGAVAIFFLSETVGLSFAATGIAPIFLFRLSDGGGSDCGCGDCGGCGDPGSACESGCMGCDCGTGDPGGGGCAGSCSGDFSTPFLYVWEGSGFRMDNDFLLGEPTTLYPTRREGQRAYESRQTAVDLYRIQRQCAPRDGKLSFQVKEIEPEESFLDYVSLSHLIYPRRGIPIINSRHDTFRVFDREEMSSSGRVTLTGISVNGKTADRALTDLRTLAEDSPSPEYTLNPGDRIEVSAVVSHTALLVLLVRSRYRDWLASYHGLFQSETTSSPVFISTTVGFAARAGIIAMAAFVWMAQASTTVFHKIIGKQTSQKTSLLGIPHVFADTPPPPSCGSCGSSCGSCGSGRSLVIEYWNWNEEAYTQLDILEPRSKHRSTESIDIPAEEAVSAGGEVRLRITATMRHIVDLAALFSPERELPYTEEKMVLTRAFHHRLEQDMTATLTEPFGGKYLHTVPGDVVDLEFSLPKKKAQKGEQEAYLLSAGGFYTPLTREGMHLAGNWIDSLDPEARERVEELRAQHGIPVAII